MFFILIFLIAKSFAFEAHSLHAPYGPQYWTISGNATSSDHFIRLTPQRQSQKGGLWNVFQNTYEHFEAMFAFTITGAANLGADGLAFWYTSERNTVGELFGNTGRFTGIGVIVDTYDNDNTGVHPYVMLVFNDGFKEFSHYHQVPDDQDSGAGDAPHDHEHQSRNPLELGGCSVDVRNRGQVTLRLLNKPGKLLELYVRPGPNEPETLCASGELDVAPGGYFGFTAATGDLADAHDVYELAVRPLNDEGLIEPEELPPAILASVIHEVARSQHMVQDQLADMAERIEEQVSTQEIAWSELSSSLRGDSMANAYRDVEPRGGADNSEVVGSLSSMAAEVQQLKSALQTLKTQLQRSISMGFQQARQEEKQNNNNNNNSNSNAAQQGDSPRTWMDTLQLLLVTMCLAVLLLERLEKQKEKRNKTF